MIIKKNVKQGISVHRILANEIPKDLIIPHDESSLRPIARRTLKSLKERREYTKNFTPYNFEINKLILHELTRDETK